MEYKFTKDILGSNNGIAVQEYKEGQIIAKQDLADVLFTAWAENGTIVPADEQDIPEGEVEENEAEGEEEQAEETQEETSETQEESSEEQGEDIPEGEVVEGFDEVEEIPEEAEEISEEEALKLEAKKLLEADETSIDVERLKEIGIALKINGMATCSKAETIVKKVSDFLA